MHADAEAETFSLPFYTFVDIRDVANGHYNDTVKLIKPAHFTSECLIVYIENFTKEKKTKGSERLQ
jgi:hypothetical protein